MSMTPLQAIAATKFVNGEGLAPHRIQSAADAYAEHPLVVLMRQHATIQANVDNDFPVASGGIRASDAVFFAQFGSSTNTEDAMVDYATHVLCDGDIGKFASVVDKCTGLIVAVGDVTATIEKASTMSFSDLGPGVKNHGDAINMGLGPAMGKLKEAMEKANNGQLPKVEGVPQTDTAIVGTVILAQGEVSGDSASPNFGTAIGIYEAAKKKGLTDSIDAIHQEFLKQPVPVAGKITKTSGKYIRPTAVTNMTEAQFNELMDLTYASAVEDEASANEDERIEAVQVKAWVDARREKGYTSFIEMVRKIVLKIMNDPSKYRQDPFLEVVVKLTVESENHMKEAIDALPLDQAKKLFQGLGSKIQIEKLEKWTDVLDVAKCAAAMPEPLTTKTAPASVTTNTDEIEPPPQTPNPEAVPKVEGSLEKAKESQTAYQEAAKLKSNQADIAAGKPPSEWNVTPEQVERNRAISKSGPSVIPGIGNILGDTSGGLTTLTASTAVPTAGVPGPSLTKDITGAQFAASYNASLDKFAQTPAGKSALGQQALTMANSLKGNLAGNVDSLRAAATDFGAQTNAGPVNLENIQQASVSSMKSLGADMGQINGFGNMADMKSLGGMLRSVETSMPVPLGNGLGRLTEPVTVTDADIEEARKLKSNAADVAAGKPPEEWNVTPEQFVRNSKMNKALTPTFLNNLSGVMPPEIKTELQAAVGTGSGAGGSYSLLDFVGSAVGENGQMDNWKTILSSLDSLWAKYQTDLEREVAGGTYTSALSDIVFDMAASVEGNVAENAYEDNIAKMKAEYTLLTTKAGIDFATIPAGDLTNTLNLSKKIAQMASKLDSGHAAVFQNAADPNSMGGQALLGVMVEARNTKLLQKAGLQPANSIVPSNKTEVTDQDRAEAAKIQAKSGDPDAITPEQVARNRALNNTLKGLFGVS